MPPRYVRNPDGTITVVTNPGYSPDGSGYYQNPNNAAASGYYGSSYGGGSYGGYGYGTPYTPAIKNGGIMGGIANTGNALFGANNVVREGEQLISNLSHFLGVAKGRKNITDGAYNETSIYANSTKTGANNSKTDELLSERTMKQVKEENNNQLQNWSPEKVQQAKLYNDLSNQLEKANEKLADDQEKYEKLSGKKQTKGRVKDEAGLAKEIQQEQAEQADLRTRLADMKASGASKTTTNTNQSTNTNTDPNANLTAKEQSTLAFMNAMRDANLADPKDPAKRQLALVQAYGALMGMDPQTLKIDPARSLVDPASGKVDFPEMAIAVDGDHLVKQEQNGTKPGFKVGKMPIPESATDVMQQVSSYLVQLKLGTAVPMDEVEAAHKKMEENVKKPVVTDKPTTTTEPDKTPTTENTDVTVIQPKLTLPASKGSLVAGSASTKDTKPAITREQCAALQTYLIANFPDQAADLKATLAKHPTWKGEYGPVTAAALETILGSSPAGLTAAKLEAKFPEITQPVKKIANTTTKTEQNSNNTQKLVQQQAVTSRDIESDFFAEITKDMGLGKMNQETALKTIAAVTKTDFDVNHDKKVQYGEMVEILNNDKVQGVIGDKAEELDKILEKHGITKDNQGKYAVVNASTALVPAGGKLQSQKNIPTV